jgi:hypothetical protein
LDEGLFIAGAVMVAIAIGVIAATTLAAFLRTAAPAPMAVANRWGLVGLLAAQASGVWMLGHGLALLEDDADPLLQSMSTVGAAGSMKFAHAVPMHAIQVLAALAGLLSLSGRSQHRQTQLVALAVVGYGGLFAIALLRTTFGLTPVGWLDASTFGYLLAAALLAAPAAVAITAVTAHSRHAPSPRANPMQPPVTVPAARAAPHRHRRLADPTTEEGWNRAHRVVRDFRRRPGLGQGRPAAVCGAGPRAGPGPLGPRRRRPALAGAAQRPGLAAGRGELRQGVYDP